MKFIEQLVRSKGHDGPLAYFHPNWRRDAAPLLDQLGASVDHVEAHVAGGSNNIDNLATICVKCNVRKGKLAADEHLRRNPIKRVKGTHGEPIHWDGLSSVFVILASENGCALNATKRAWLAALR